MLAEPGGNWVVAPLARSVTTAVGVSAESSETTTTASNLIFGRFVNGPGDRLPLRSSPQTYTAGALLIRPWLVPVKVKSPPGDSSELARTAFSSARCGPV